MPAAARYTRTLNKRILLFNVSTTATNAAEQITLNTTGILSGRYSNENKTKK